MSTGSLDSYDVERILDKRVVKNKVYYRLKWKNYPVKDATWEPIIHLSRSCMQMVEDFELKFKNGNERNGKRRKKKLIRVSAKSHSKKRVRTRDRSKTQGHSKLGRSPSNVFVRNLSKTQQNPPKGSSHDSYDEMIKEEDWDSFDSDTKKPKRRTRRNRFLGKRSGNEKIQLKTRYLEAKRIAKERRKELTSLCKDIQKIKKQQQKNSILKRRRSKNVYNRPVKQQAIKNIKGPKDFIHRDRLGIPPQFLKRASRRTRKKPEMVVMASSDSEEGSPYFPKKEEYFQGIVKCEEAARLAGMLGSKNSSNSKMLNALKRGCLMSKVRAKRGQPNKASNQINIVTSTESILKKRKVSTPDDEAQKRSNSKRKSLLEELNFGILQENSGSKKPFKFSYEKDKNREDATTWAEIQQKDNQLLVLQKETPDNPLPSLLQDQSKNSVIRRDYPGSLNSDLQSQQKSFQYSLIQRLSNQKQSQDNSNKKQEKLANVDNVQLIQTENKLPENKSLAIKTGTVTVTVHASQKKQSEADNIWKVPKEWIRKKPLNTRNEGIEKWLGYLTNIQTGAIKGLREQFFGDNNSFYDKSDKKNNSITLPESNVETEYQAIPLIAEETIIDPDTNQDAVTEPQKKKSLMNTEDRLIVMSSESKPRNTGQDQFPGDIQSLQKSSAQTNNIVDQEPQSNNEERDSPRSLGDYTPWKNNHEIVNWSLVKLAKTKLNLDSILGEDPKKINIQHQMKSHKLSENSNNSDSDIDDDEDEVVEVGWIQGRSTSNAVNTAKVIEINTQTSEQRENGELDMGGQPEISNPEDSQIAQQLQIIKTNMIQKRMFLLKRDSLIEPGSNQIESHSIKDTSGGNARKIMHKDSSGQIHLDKLVREKEDLNLRLKGLTLVQSKGKFAKTTRPGRKSVRFMTGPTEICYSPQSFQPENLKQKKPHFSILSKRNHSDFTNESLDKCPELTHQAETVSITPSDSLTELQPGKQHKSTDCDDLCGYNFRSFNIHPNDDFKILSNLVVSKKLYLKVAHGYTTSSGKKKKHTAYLTPDIIKKVRPDLLCEFYEKNMRFV